MSWIRLDDDLIDHPKWVAILTAAREAHPGSRAEARNASRNAALAWLGALVWSCRVNSDGVIPETVLGTIAPRVFLTDDEIHDAAPLLVAAGLWHSIPKRRGGPGWEIHDFADYQKARAQVDLEESREARKKALYRTREGQVILAAVKRRDRDRCRYCWVEVKWEARRGGRRGTIDHVDPDGPNSVENCVVACGACNRRKSDRTPAEAEMTLRPPFFGDEPARHDVANVDDPDPRDPSVSVRDSFANESRPIRTRGSGRVRSGQVEPERADSGPVGRGSGAGQNARREPIEPDAPPPPKDHDYPGDVNP